MREIGIRGDCVYAVYTTPTADDELDIATKAFYINTFMKMLNTLLSERGLPTIRVGIGQSTDQELVVKAGRKGVGINSKIWIGKAVTRACHYANYGGKDGNPPLVFSEKSYDYFIEGLKARNSSKTEKEVESWFTYHKDEGEGAYYTANVIKTEFDNWIQAGMVID